MKQRVATKVLQVFKLNFITSLNFLSNKKLFFRCYVIINYASQPYSPSHPTIKIETKSESLLIWRLLFWKCSYLIWQKTRANQSYGFSVLDSTCMNRSEFPEQDRESGFGTHSTLSSSRTVLYSLQYKRDISQTLGHIGSVSAVHASSRLLVS